MIPDIFCISTQMYAFAKCYFIYSLVSVICCVFTSVNVSFNIKTQSHECLCHIGIIIVGHKTLWRTQIYYLWNMA